jgi:nicotinate-nucleotide pyrophosphorylase (carboxylating)
VSSAALTAGPRRITEELLTGVLGRHRAVVSATGPGIVAGLDLLAEAMPAGAARWHALAADGDRCEPDTPVLELVGTAAELAVAEDYVLGPLGFASGVAITATALGAACPDGMRLACGGWKKLPLAMKPLLRAGLSVAGVTPRLVEGEFVYVAKTTVALLGGPVAAARAAAALHHGPVSIQVAGVAEALAVVSAGARIVMVDDGRLETLAAIDGVLRGWSLRREVTLAFAGGVTRELLAPARAAGADVVDVGRAVLDAPLWDLHLEIAG